MGFWKRGIATWYNLICMLFPAHNSYSTTWHCIVIFLTIRLWCCYTMNEMYWFFLVIVFYCIWLEAYDKRKYQQGRSHWYGKGGSYLTTFSAITNGKPHLFWSINRKGVCLVRFTSAMRLKSSILSVPDVQMLHFYPRKCIRNALRQSENPKFSWGSMPPDPPSKCALRACNATATPTQATRFYRTTSNLVATALISD